MISTELIDIIKNARRVAVLTGAGVSQESGLRTFRDAQDGFWAQYQPEDLATPEAFARNPKLVWDWYAMRREKADQALPNPGHHALAELARLIANFDLITQNVDGLHQKAGSPLVLELHGNIHQVKCAECGQLADEWQDDRVNVPTCRHCQVGLLRPNVVWFGESLPTLVLQSAMDAAIDCDVFFSIGTSGLVHPAASLAITAQQHHACLVQINADPTSLTGQVDFFLQGKSGDLLPEIVQRIRP